MSPRGEYRETFFIYEGGTWRCRFSQQERLLQARHPNRSIRRRSTVLMSSRPLNRFPLRVREARDRSSRSARWFPSLNDDSCLLGSIIRFLPTTAFVYEIGTWKHLFLQQEVKHFLPSTSFDEFVEVW
jgi:hypothetical protein